MFFIILGVVAWICLALWPAMIAKRKGYSFLLFFLLAVLISWVITLIITLVLEDKTMTSQDKADEKVVDEVLDREEHQR